ncbi:hypothetical protein SmJEL517_g02955 [Synchytrium microbalum]|uniref:Cas1p 10 TM acyl transferase domain-containing protein n=1 Tax=Synchytrium microbalum TaxID=1806994 RepID=A0A507C4R7_9FUNG|nr:uncharacterized protein SmJEL517_g02955 [Synchytrium microbalum]TPX34388.1 hypothetical protein SmJEL517_g02955 [Synchytrium microbalum]
MNGNNTSGEENASLLMQVLSEDGSGHPNETESTETHAKRKSLVSKSPSANAKFKGSGIWFTMVQACIAITVISAIVRWFRKGSHVDCNGILQDSGRWIYSPTSNRKGLSYQLLQCTLHEYNAAQTWQCLGDPISTIRTRIHGDSSARNIYYGLLDIFSKDPLPSNVTTFKAHQPILTTFPRNIEHHFIYDPFLNGTEIEQDLSEKPHVPISMLAISFGPWYMRYGGPKGDQDFIERVGALLGQLATLRDPAAPVSYLLPLPPVVEALLSEERKATLKNPRIADLNIEMAHLAATAHYLDGASDTSAAIYVRAFEDLYRQAAEASTDGLHYDLAVSRMAVQLLLNHRCNAEILKSMEPHAAPSATCCRQYQPPRVGQVLMMSFLVAVILWVSAIRYLDVFSKWRPKNTDILVGMEGIAIALVYMYLADRTWIFGKAGKHFDVGVFGLILLVPLVLGMMTLETLPKDELLNRHQTDEWKGWMQIAILVYHFLGGSQVMWLYILIRILVASYIFMTGFGHAQFFDAKQDFSASRAIKVLVRLNILPVLLSLTMGSPYVGYYFSPLVSVWFAVIWIVFWIGHTYSTSLTFVLFKIISASVITKALISFPPITEVLFNALKGVGLGQGWDANEWRFRLELDSYICFIGVAMGFLLSRFRKMPVKPSWILGAVVGSVIGIVLLVYMIYMEETQLDNGVSLAKVKVHYNTLHIGISAIPVVSYAILRNSTAKLRKTYSGFFAWFGRISLETFIMQFHILLAADTKATLVVLPGVGVVWWLNLVVVTVVFLYASERVAHGSTIIGDWILSDGNWRFCLPVVALVVFAYAVL